MNNIAQIESLIFVSGDDGISLDELVSTTGFDNVATLNLIEELKEELADNAKNPLQLVESDHVYRLVTKGEYSELLSRFYQSPINNKLSNAALETLTIIAYKQPITRVEVDKIRGVNSSGSISRLMARDLIEEDGRKKEIGRPLLYKTTNFFLDYFGLSSIEQLPELPSPEEFMSEENYEQSKELFKEKEHDDADLNFDEEV